MKKYNITSRNKKNNDAAGASSNRKKIKVKTAKGRKLSSTMWLRRHINDQFVQRSKIEGYLSRAAYKLLEINKKFKILTPNIRYALDLGAIPGSWSQVLLKKLSSKNSTVVAVDILSDIKIQERPNFHFICGNFLDLEIQKKIIHLTNGNKFDIILSDIAPNSVGDKVTDRLMIENIIESIVDFSKGYLSENGVLVFKNLHGCDTSVLYNQLNKMFNSVSRFKPQASRSESSEMYMICIGFNYNEQK